MLKLAAACLLLGSGASAQDAKPSGPPTAPAVAVDTAAPQAPAAEAPKAMWVKRKVSLLYKDQDGDIVNELPLTHNEETAGGRATVHDVSGGVSSNGRFAYVFDKSDVWNAAKTKLLSRACELRVYGSDGQRLWETPYADAPEGRQPLVFSADGETALVLLKREKGWYASLRDYLGATLLELGPFPKIDAAELTPSGRYAMVAWLVPDKDSTHTFVDVKTKTRKDIPSGDLYLGQAWIGDDGKVVSDKKVVFDFGAPEAEKP